VTIETARESAITIEEAIEEGLSALGRVIRRSPYAYTTTWPLEEVDVVQKDGRPLELLVKRLQGPESGKPAFIGDPAREVEAYALLAPEQLGTPRCYASGRWWLALEKVPGTPLWQRGDIESWEAAARWAAGLHQRFAGRQLDGPHLLNYDATYYRRWFDRARDSAGEAMTSLLPASEIAISRLLALPQTLIHGELYASNVVVTGGRIAPVDWEMAATGPGVIDLAALIAGWDESSQQRMIAAFGPTEPADLAAAQLLLALQWLGWGTDWHPPLPHRHDWLTEARHAARLLL
jgi:Phosphotransferase enzyme family